jgi:dTDP-4-dehydrorhamnose 3,5-epimerase
MKSFFSEVLCGTFLVQTTCFEDARGKFWKFYSERTFQGMGSSRAWKDLNICTSKLAGTFRGLHYQLPPHAEAKLIGCIEGEILDVLFDLRPDSTTFKKSVAIKLSAIDGNVVFIPEGIAHGYLTLVDNTTVAYLASAYHNAEFERVISWREPLLGIEWPTKVAVVSEKDAVADGLDNEKLEEIVSIHNRKWR